MNKFFLWVVSLSFCHLQLMYANTSQRSLNNFSTGIGTPIVTSTTDTLDKGSWSVNERTEYYRTRPIADAELLKSAEYESQTGLLINYLLMSYGLIDNFTAGISIPIQRSYHLRGLTEIDDNIFRLMNLGDISGLADTTIFGMWRITEGNNKLPLTTALFIGLNTPTGKTTVKTTTGELFDASDQPGTGAWMPVAGLIFSKNFGHLSISNNYFYTQTTKGTQDTLLGSYFDYNFAVTYPAFKHSGKTYYSVDAILELTGEYWKKDKVQGIKSPNSGGNSIYLNPGFRVNIGETTSFYLGAGFPISEKLNGTQSPSQYALYGGIDISFE
ncbi:hypothetical protein A8135_07705 [Legionella jamestowniensis]|uniref:Transporter n=1 Tax=Legionella jamestowniensis TaxID=455 RepID=A0ABX2XXG9_9GAMM|nr:hypothetical protein [Legionella jamestowniensis]OCH99132.1 hypothetical protein A8135_07705 [Legionella jamestowniensis]